MGEARSASSLILLPNLRSPVKILVIPFPLAAGFVMVAGLGRPTPDLFNRFGARCVGRLLRRCRLPAISEPGRPLRLVGNWIAAGSLIALLAGCADAPLNQTVPPAVRAMYSA